VGVSFHDFGTQRYNEYIEITLDIYAMKAKISSCLSHLFGHLVELSLQFVKQYMGYAKEEH